MEGIYDATLAGASVGKVRVTKEGLYYCFSCQCRLPDDMIRRLVAVCDREQSLGILVPENGEYTLRTRQPVKLFPGADIAFRIVPKHSSMEGKLIPLSPEEPFHYLQRLKDAYLVRRGKTEPYHIYVCFPDSH